MRNAMAGEFRMRDGWELERAAFNGGVLGGLAMVVVGVAWLLLGLQDDRVFIYPIVLVAGGVILAIAAAFGTQRRGRRRDATPDAAPPRVPRGRRR